jgi:hypothetical protein
MTDRMPALTIFQPWPWAIATQGKTPENRTQRIRYRGPVAIHAGKIYDGYAVLPEPAAGKLGAIIAGVRLAGCITPEARYLTLGAVVAVADLTGCHHASECQDQHGALCTPWARPASWHWELGSVRPLAALVRCRGKQGLWRLPEDAETAVRAQLTDKETAA